MRRNSRELNIFSMSALDLFASSLGAFILITLVLMPFYLREEGPVEEPVPIECPIPEPVPTPVCPICPAPEPTPACPICPAPEPTPIPVCPVCPAPEPVPACPVPEPTPPAVIEVADNLLVVQMEWSRLSDVDLHVHTPDGEFYFGRRRIPGSPGRITLDNTRGGSNSMEIWKAHLPTPGRYRVCARLFSGREASSVSVRLLLDKPTGPVAPRSVTLRRDGQEECPIEFEIDSEFSYTAIRP